jgi:general secretion pathway protein C
MFRVLEDWSRAAWRPNARTLLAGLEVVLVVLLALQAARLIWSLAEPRGAVGASQTLTARPSGATDLSILQRFDPFFRVAAPVAGADGGSSQGDLQLYGVRSDGRGGGSAIIGGPDGRQGSFVVGEEVAPGVILRAVAADHVTLARGGASRRLDFAEPSSTPPPMPASAGVGTLMPPAPPAPAQESAGAVDPKQFLAAASLTPRTVNGQTSGYRLAGRGKAEVLARAGLQDGDVLLAVEGSPLNAERLSELPELLAQSQEVELRFERGGQILTTRLRMAAR